VDLIHISRPGTMTDCKKADWIGINGIKLPAIKRSAPESQSLV
jgi:hypothetical protein